MATEFSKLRGTSDIMFTASPRTGGAKGWPLDEARMLLKRRMVKVKSRSEQCAFARNEDSSSNCGQKGGAIDVRDQMTIASGRMDRCDGWALTLVLKPANCTHVYNCFNWLQDYRFLSFEASARTAARRGTAFRMSLRNQKIRTARGVMRHSRTGADDFPVFIILDFPLVHQAGRRLRPDRIGAFSR
jgi:hypothetical protein